MAAALSNTAAMVVLGMDSATVNVLTRKLGSLHSLLDGRENVGSEVMRTLMDDVELVQVCRGLEDEFGTTFTNCLLRNEGTASIREIKEELQESDRTKLVVQHTQLLQTSRKK